jgi:hypothetical protein
MKSVVTPSPALDCLPLFVKRFMQKNRLPIPYLIPVRRNCLSGSGKEHECHANSYALAKRFGGEAINGYSIYLRTENDELKSIFFTDHTVWKTPECKLVDVTAHNYTDTDLEIFAPVSSLLKKRFIFPSVEITPDYLKNGVSFDFGCLKVNSIVREIIKVKETYASAIRSTILIPASRMSHELFTLRKEQISQECLNDLYKSADFSLPSTATGKYWNEITEMNNMHEVKNESKQ